MIYYYYKKHPNILGLVLASAPDNEKSNLGNLPVMGNSENWYQFEAINVPVLTFSGSNETNNYLHLDLLKDKAKSCNDFEYKIIDNTSHFDTNKENEIGDIILDWIRNRF